MEVDLQQVRARILGHFAMIWGSNGLAGYLARSGAASFLLRLTQRIIQICSAVLLARLMRPEGYGAYAFVMSIVALLAIPAKSGVSVAVVRFTATYHAQEEWGRLRALWRSTTLLVLGLSLITVLVAGLVAIKLAPKSYDMHLPTFLMALLLLPRISSPCFFNMPSKD